MPVLGAPLDFAKLEARNLRAHVLGSPPSSPVTGQLYYDSGTNQLFWWDGSVWQSAKQGSTVPDATTGVKGIVQLAGDLAGTAALPQIAAGVITDAEVNAANKDGVAGTAGMRTLGTGAQQAAPGNHTLNSHPAPVAALPMNGQKITGMADGTAATDAATKGQVDGIISGLDVKQSCRVATVGPITIATGLNSGDVIDGVTLANGDRVLVKDQTAPAQNGIYVAGVTPARSTDADTSAEVTAGLFTFVSEGTVNADSGWYLMTNLPITLDTTALQFVQFSGAGQITDGAALLKTGNTLDVRVDGTTIEVNADLLRVKAAGISANELAVGAVDLTTTDVTGALPATKGGTGQATAKAGRETGLGAAGYYSSATHAAGTTITITQATHGLRSSRGLIVQCQLEADGSVVWPDIAVAANGDVTVTFAVSQTLNTIRTTIIG